MKNRDIVTYKFNNKDYLSYDALGAAFYKFSDEALVAIASNNFIDLFKFDKIMSNKVHKVLHGFKDLEVKLGIITYLLNPDEGLMIDKKLYKTIFDIANYMDEYYPKYDKKVRKFFLEGAVSYVFYNDHELTINPETKGEVKFLKTLERNFNIDFFYYYFFESFKTTRSEYDVNNRINLSEIRDKIVNNVSSEFDMVLKCVYELSHDNDLLHKLVDNIGFDVVYNYCLKKQKDFFYPFVELVEKYFHLNIGDFLKQGYHMWLLDEYPNYKYHTKEAKTIKKLIAKLSAMSKKFSNNEKIMKEVASKALAVYKRFSDLFEKNILTTNKVVHITTKDFDYFLSIKLNNIYVCRKYYEKNYMNISRSGLVHLSIETTKKTMSEDLTKSLFKYDKVVKKGKPYLASLEVIDKIHKNTFNVLMLSLLIMITMGLLVMRYHEEWFYGASFLGDLSYGLLEGINNLVLFTLMFAVTSFLLLFNIVINFLSSKKYTSALDIYSLFLINQMKIIKAIKNVSDYKYGQMSKSTSLGNKESVLLGEKEYKRIINLNNKKRPLGKDLTNYKDILFDDKYQIKYRNFLVNTKDMKLKEQYKINPLSRLISMISITLSLFIINFILMIILARYSNSETVYFVRNYLGVIESWSIIAAFIMPAVFIIFHLNKIKFSLLKQMGVFILGFTLLVILIILAPEWLVAIA